MSKANVMRGTYLLSPSRYLRMMSQLSSILKGIKDNLSHRFFSLAHCTFTEYSRVIYAIDSLKEETST